MTIDILLSTYNSQDYIDDLLNSLLAQTYKNWSLIVRDDCSTDDTIAILNDFKKANSTKLIVINNDGQALGPKKSFEKLLENSSSDYIMFCDHDDYWLPNKIQDSLKQIHELKKNNPNQPALVFTDLTVVDQYLNIIHSSFWKYSKVNPNNIFNTYKLLINNPAPGCTFIFNAAVKKLVLPFPEQARMHDWWIALKVSESGVANYLDQSTILYRQHKNNKIGAEQISGAYFKNRISDLSLTFRQNLLSYRMMKCLNQNYSILKLIYYKFHISLSKVLKKKYL